LRERKIFRQFALTISLSMLISAVNAITMTPARAAWIFASRKPGQHADVFDALQAYLGELLRQ
jgi:multidrug efflux pump subunit AcrB